MPTPAGDTPPAHDDLAALEAAVDRSIAECDGNPRPAVRVLVVAVAHLTVENESLRAEIDELAAAVSRGYARGRIRRGGDGAPG